MKNLIVTTYQLANKTSANEADVVEIEVPSEFGSIQVIIDKSGDVTVTAIDGNGEIVGEHSTISLNEVWNAPDHQATQDS